jgi:L-ascorbate metabolism protein UlaG (beta-lactamase superfamily)
MDLQFYGANCLSLAHKGMRIVIDDNLADLGAKAVTKNDDITLFTGPHGQTKGRLVFDGPGDYEVADISVVGIAARAHIDEPGKMNATMFKIITSEFSILITGHIYPNLNDKQLEAINTVDVMIVPVGGNGYTVDPTGALKLIKDIEPKLVVPTNFADESLNFPVPQQTLGDALKEMAMEPKETVSRLHLKPSDFSDVTQLVILENS